MPSIIALLCIFSAFIGVFGEIGSEHGHRLHAQEKGNVNARKNAKHAKSASQQAANALNVAENAKIVADAAYVCYDDAQCDACYECNEQGTRCVPIEVCLQIHFPVFIPVHIRLMDTTITINLRP